MAEILDTVLLLALPASGKSEVRRYLDLLSPQECRDDFHMGPTVQLDDFPYVHLMRVIDDSLEGMGEGRIFFQAGDKPFQDTKDWGTLIHLVNEDYEDLVAGRKDQPASAGTHLMARLDAAGAKAGLPARLAALDDKIRAALAEKIDKEAVDLLAAKHAGVPDTLQGKTLVIEFARGGPDGSDMPLPKEYGYRYSLAQLSDALLSKSVILYIWVTPEESRRKNDARADPDDPGSILHHGVPMDVMLGDYGCDDLDWLEAQADKPGTIKVEAHGKTYHLPVARFDNRVDKTTFIRDDQASCPKESIEALHSGLAKGFGDLVGALESA